ncbi:hypothetical protein AYO21_10693 [Fonsecaea monophora]|uniref:Glycosyl transferase n=1 Tax=Fonsecaea monophora TaxID=254056 RepID=A0A177EU31_9EURO|nr:hypothetical protein AYO21_10693 [Fonsecaea monophora]KAH0835268.1 putative glycosyl transferase [Fonsecaea pedrosoi]OAG35126.1 hypothetical protein AYO21_10693 [Fonsecaea monophora]
MNHGVPVRVRRTLMKLSQRFLPVYIFVCGLVILLISQVTFRGPQHANAAELVRRDATPVVTSTKPGGFPQKIWQSWKVDALDLEGRDLFCARSWMAKNPNYRYEVLTDSNDIQYLETHFGPGGLNRPDIIDVYRLLTAKIIKADLLRYLIMYVEGGVYVDIDVEALKPLDRFIPDSDQFKEDDIDMIIGVEIDQPKFIKHPILGSKCKSFCQWTFICKPRLPVMLRLVENIIEWLQDLSQKQGVSISDLSLGFDDVISGTGPSAFTDAILEEMSRRESRNITWDVFHNIDEARLVGGVLVLTVEAFAAGQGHSDSGDHNSRHALVKHHYHASGWPTVHQRYKHPMYDEVELCNWDVDCVQLWDFSTALFDSLPPEEQARQLAEKMGQGSGADNAAPAPAPVLDLPPPPPPEELNVQFVRRWEPAPTIVVATAVSAVNAILSPSIQVNAAPVSIVQRIGPVSVEPVTTHGNVQASMATVYVKATAIPN